MDQLPGLVALCSAVATYLLGVTRYHTTNRNVSSRQPMTSEGSVRALTALTVVLALALITR